MLSGAGREPGVGEGPANLRSALLTSLPLGHPRRDLGARSAAELGKNVRLIASIWRSLLHRSRGFHYRTLFWVNDSDRLPAWQPV
jgi:hypothetical protein